MVSNALEAIGFVLIVAGVALVSIPGALLVAGGGFVLAGVALDRTTNPNEQTDA